MLRIVHGALALTMRVEDQPLRRLHHIEIENLPVDERVLLSACRAEETISTLFQGAMVDWAHIVSTD